MSKSLEKQYMEAYLKLCKVTDELGLKDPFTGARGKEIFAAFTLKHKAGKDYAGADGHDKNGGCEYKSTTTSNKTQKFVYDFYIKKTWKEQLVYLKKEKIGLYKNHYMIVFNTNGTIAEVWKLSSKQILNLIIENLKERFDDLLKSKTKTTRVCPRPNKVREIGKRVL